MAPLPTEAPSFEARPTEARSTEAPPFDDRPFYPPPIEGRPLVDDLPIEDRLIEDRLIDDRLIDDRPELVANAPAPLHEWSGSEPSVSEPDDAELPEPPPPVIGTIRAAVRVPGLLIERPPATGDDEDRPLAVPRALAVPPVVEKSEPALDGPVVTYSAEDWRSNVRGSAAVSAESGGTVYVSDVDGDDDEEPLSLTQKLLRSGVIVLLIVLFVAAFRYGPNIDQWLHS